MNASAPPLISGTLTEVSECRYGRMIYLRHDMCVSRSLALYGEWSEGEPELFRQLVFAGDVVAEVGANIGTHTVSLARMVGENGAVIAFEPQRFVYHLLCANIALNELMNVHPRQTAVGAAPGMINVPMFDFGVTNNVGGLILGGEGGEQVAVETIDSLGFQRLKLLKIDVEGMETEVLAGAVDTVQRCRPYIYVENEFSEKSEELIRQIRGFGYRLWWHRPPMFNPANFAGNAEDVFPGIVSNNMLCLPAESGRDVAGLQAVRSPDERP